VTLVTVVTVGTVVTVVTVATVVTVMTKKKLCCIFFSFFCLITQIVTKLKNTNCDKTQKLNLGHYSKTKTVTKLKKSNFDITQKHKF
jgi:uncharacterized membrane protein